MKIYSTDLMTLLASGMPMTRTELFAIGPCRNGAMIYATPAKLPVSYGGNVYQPAAYGDWSRGDIPVKIGLESNSCDLTVFADNQVPVYFPGTSNAALLMDGINYGLLDDAAVTIYCLYNSDYLAAYAFPAVVGPTSGSLVETKFVGQVAETPLVGMTKATVTVQDLLYLLNIQVPRRVFQASCSHTLFDAGCTLSATARERTGVFVSSLGVANTLTLSGNILPVTPSGTFTLGVLTWTSGKNAGLSALVRQWTSGVPLSQPDTVQLDVAPLFPVASGDECTITQGCNKMLTSCADLQGSTLAAMTNYGGQPDTPVPETAIGGDS